VTSISTLDSLAKLGPRRACSDGERRAARLLAAELRALERKPRTETHWIRPQWPAVWLVHAVLGVVGSIAATESAPAGLGLLGATTLSALLELGGRVPALSLLWPRRATQNVVSEGPGTAPVRLLITAAYDAPRSRSGVGAPVARLDAALRRASRGRWPSPLGLLTLALAALCACAGARLAGIDESWLGAVQLVPTVVCLGATALLADLSFAPPVDAANPAASAPAAALALVRELDRRPPRRLEVDVVFAGAGDARAAGMRRFVAARRKTLRPEELAVLHFEPSGAGEPRAWRRDGPLLSVGLHPDLVSAGEQAGFAPYAGRGTTGAYVARGARWPAVAVGRLDGSERVPDEADPAALGDTVERAVALVRRLDARLAGPSS
jgi:hypothetical protein